MSILPKKSENFPGKIGQNWLPYNWTVTLKKSWLYSWIDFQKITSYKRWIDFREIFQKWNSLGWKSIFEKRTRIKTEFTRNDSLLSWLHPKYLKKHRYDIEASKSLQLIFACIINESFVLFLVNSKSRNFGLLNLYKIAHNLY